jgi:SpoVK/Ycf46/Vps4 family AAA+-type ATPase
MDIITEWENHLEKIDEQIVSMWNFIVYKDFNDNMTNKLNKRIDTLTDENKLLRLKRKNDCCDETEPKKKKTEFISQVNQLKKEYKLIYNSKKKYHFMKEDNRLVLAKSIYKKLDSIVDIIRLKDHPNKFDFVHDTKFTRLYNIIPTLEELNKIIGMKNVKDKLFNSICYFLHSMNNSEEMNHVMIMGPPGVGKTTIAKIIGDLYLKLGFLHNNNFIVAKRSDLIAKYLGQTAIKTQEVIDSALGGVLFIDEVYSLGNEDKRDSFAKECIDTINLNMSRTDKPWLLIVGGYKTEIEKEFLSYNKGLERRFTVKLEINEYSAQELFDILMKFVKEEKWEVELDGITVDDITRHFKHFKYSGGDMRKLLQLAKENNSVRQMKESLYLEGVSRFKLSKDDFTKSLEQFVKKEEKDAYYHQTMYV